ncbi:MAG: hypothetical protein KDB82_10075 [Planctomycetes bacterium]|nr:hypothetical protein [Planctomycetota bacterium]
MRYRSVLVCFLALSFAVTACTFDDGDDPTDDEATAVAGSDLVIDIGAARLEISQAAIGTGTGQLAPGSKVKLHVVDQDISGRKLYSPIYEVSVTDDTGAAVTGLNLDPYAVLEISWDQNLAANDGHSPAEISMLKIDGTTIDELSFTTLSPTPDSEYTQAFPGRARALLTSFSRFAMSDGGSGATTPPSATALTGTTSTVLTATLFQLADSGSVYSVNVAVPTALTTTPPAVINLNDASFDAGMPTDPNNRAVTVQTGGVTYTSDSPTAGVVFQLDTFTGSGSSGSLVGTVIEQGGSASLAINFTFTTGTAGANALGGTVTDLAGRRTMNLQDSGGGETVVVVMPDTFPNVALDPVTFDSTTYNAGTPTDPANRLVTVNDGSLTYTSFVPVLASVTVTFTSFDSMTLVGAGTITGTVAEATPTLKTLNYTFTTTAGGTGGGGGFTAGTPVDITTTDVADETAITFDIDTGNYLGVWLSDVGTTNRTLEVIDINADTMATTTQNSMEPTAALDPAGGLGCAADNAQDLCIVGATGGNAATDSVIAIFYDYGIDSLNTGAEMNLGTGSAPRVVYHVDQDHFVVAWQSGADVMAQVFDWDGTTIGSAFTAISNATLKGLAAPDDATDEALITADDGSGIVGQYVTVSTGAASGSNFDLSTSLSGGLCAYDPVGGNYVVLIQQLVGGFFTSQVALALSPSTTVPVGSALTLAAAAEPTQSCSGNAGTIFSDTGANLYPVDSSASGPAMVDNALLGSINGLNIDTTSDGAPLAGAGTNRYVLLAAKGSGGVTAIPLTLTP